MDNGNVQFVGGPCGQHGPYSFYKAFKYTKNGVRRIVTLSEFFFVKMWRDSDLLCIGELQLLWADKNSEQVLASLRLYFLPENTPEGRLEHGEDEVLAISEKVVIRVEDLVTWITTEAEWTWGRLAKCEKDFDTEEEKKPKKGFSLIDNGLDFSDVENERKIWEQQPGKSSDSPNVIILSYPKYCRYRAAMRRLADAAPLRAAALHALGGFRAPRPATRVLFCRDTFDYPELEGHELLCNHLAPKLKGRPRGRRKKRRSLSPNSDAESEASLVSVGVNVKNESGKNGIRSDPSGVTPRRSTRCHENNENKEFVRKLSSFMKSNRTPIGRIPSLGYKELNLHEFFSRVQRLGGYDSVTGNRLWKSIFEEMSGHQNSTSAATIIRRHYERFLLSYERHIRGEEYKPVPGSARRRLKSKRGSSSLSDAESSSDSNPTPSTSAKSPITTASPSENKDNSRVEGKTSSLRSVRVKPERQKEKQNPSEKEAMRNNNNNNNGENGDNFQQQTVKTETKTEKLIFKTESVTVETEVSTVTTQSSPVKIEYTTAKSETACPEAHPAQDSTSENVTISVKIETNLPKHSVVKFENLSNAASVKIEPSEIKEEPVKTEEPNQPVQGKENIPVLKQEPEPPLKPKPQQETDPDADPCRIKKRKLDILKEGGLEVTPVRPGAHLRPSVIHTPMPPPSTTPVKKSPAYPFLPRSTPPKVVQSCSIYSYSEKTVYGNPKDVLAPRSAHAPARSAHAPDPVDLSVHSPQKAVSEAGPSTSPYNRDSVTKNLYKANAQMMEGRRLGSNLEITLVSAHKAGGKSPSTRMHAPRGGNGGFAQAQKRLSSEDTPRYGKKSACPSSRPPDAAFAKPPPPAATPPSPAKTPHASPPFYLPHLYEQAGKGVGLAPYLPFVDPAAAAYYAALRFAGGVGAPVATPDQLKMYAELMGRLPLPFPFSLHQQTDGNHLKKQ